MMNTHQQYAKLPAFAVAIYDTIIGAEQTEDWDLMQKGMDWFSRNFTKEYMYY
jgi:wyosine [tRNA(Phe)-imidazoG37] synthetase (radical SAM superfamily)